MPSIAQRAAEGCAAVNCDNRSTEATDNVYTYILRSIEHPEQRYIGHTADLRERLKKHNKGDVPHTAKFRPWKVETYIAFESEEKSIAFEHYLKSGSGHAFAKRHF
jgi:predicted GIY-YIG superfamily endonuclease